MNLIKYLNRFFFRDYDGVKKSIDEGNLEKFKQYVEKGFDLNRTITNEVNNDFSTFAYALNQEKEDIAEFILSHKSFELRNQIVNHKENSALIYSTRKGYTRIVELLIEKKVDLNVKGNFNETALLTALMDDHTDIAILLIDNGAEISEQIFFKAVYYGNLEVTKKLISYMTIEDINESKALSVALMSNNINIVKYLIEYGADIHIENNVLIRNAHHLEDNYKLASYLVFERNLVLSKELEDKLIQAKTTLLIDLIAKRDFEKQLQKEVRQIPETPTKKQSKSFKL